MSSRMVSQHEWCIFGSTLGSGHQAPFCRGATWEHQAMSTHGCQTLLSHPDHPPKVVEDGEALPGSHPTWPSLPAWLHALCSYFILDAMLVALCWDLIHKCKKDKIITLATGLLKEAMARPQVTALSTLRKTSRYRPDGISAKYIWLCLTRQSI